MSIRLTTRQAPSVASSGSGAGHQANETSTSRRGPARAGPLRIGDLTESLRARTPLAADHRWVDSPMAPWSASDSRTASLAAWRPVCAPALSSIPAGRRANRYDPCEDQAQSVALSRRAGTPSTPRTRPAFGRMETPDCAPALSSSPAEREQTPAKGAASAAIARPVYFGPAESKSPVRRSAVWLHEPAASRASLTSRSASSLCSRPTAV
jgi:hypothetical protein